MTRERVSSIAAPEALALDTSSQDFRSLRADYRQQLAEAKLTAEMLTHIYDEADFSMFAIDLIGVEEHAPDIRIRRLDQSQSQVEQEVVEVVSFTNYSEHEGFIAFLSRTKLNPTFAYPDETVILLNVEVSLKNPDLAAQRISRVLKNSDNVKHKMFGLFRNCTKPFLAQLYPEYEAY